MKFLAFTDVHEDKEKVQKLVQRSLEEDVEFVVCAGDISTFGRGLKANVQLFKSTGKPFYLVPGNHEEGINLDEFVKDVPHVINLHRQALSIGNYLFLGYGGGGFAQEDNEFRKIAREWYGRYKGKKIVFVTHGPPFGTKIDLLHEHHVGSIDYRKFIERINPKLVICGHLHETVGMVDKIEGTRIVNPGWDGMIIELK